MRGSQFILKIKIFRKVGFKNIYTKFSDGNEGWSQKSPFDAIIITAGAIDIPEKLIEQLSYDNGILISPVENNGKQYLKSIIKTQNGCTEKIHGIVTSKGLMSVEANQRLHLPDVHVSKEEMKTYFDATVGTKFY